MNLIFDLDQTIVDSSISNDYRKSRKWVDVYKLIPNFYLYPNIRDIFDLLHKSKSSIAIVTSSPSSYAKKILSHFDLKYDSLIGYHNCQGQIKPSPVSIFLAMKELNIENPNTVLGVGDLETDIIAYNNAGIESGYCTWGLDKKKKINAIPTYTFETPLDLYTHLLLREKSTKYHTNIS
jgi:HAD superfamily hydrolase (TIGR01509 family)